MIPQRLFLASLIISTTSALSIPSEAARAVGLLPRADPVCGGLSGFSQCGGNFPSDFCCQTGSTCFGFNNDQSVICCPDNECPFINMLSCDPTIYNATQNPASPIHMADLSQGAYIPCAGTGSCCPKGYLCKDGGCRLDTSKQVVTSSQGSGPSPTTSRNSLPTTILSLSSASIQTTASTTGSDGASAATQTSATSSTTSSPQFPIEAILIGLFPGLVGGCILAFLLFCCLGRRKAKKLSSDSSSSLGPTVAKISDPIYAVDPTATRTDFLRYSSRRIVKKASRPLLGGPYTPSNGSPGGDSSISRVRSLFKRTPTSASIRSNNNHLWGSIPANAYHTPHSNHENNMPDPSSAAERALEARLARKDTVSTVNGPRTPRREPSMESIPIYNNTPDAGTFDRNTVFADLLPAVSMRTAGQGSAPQIPSPPARKDTAGLMPPIFFGSPTGTGRR